MVADGFKHIRLGMAGNVVLVEIMSTDIQGPDRAKEFIDELTAVVAESSGPIAAQHYAFLVGDEEFDAAFGRIRDQGLTYWADPGRSQRGVINHRDGGRGLYFEDPDGHLLEILTRPYGSGG